MHIRRNISFSSYFHIIQICKKKFNFHINSSHFIFILHEFIFLFIIFSYQPNRHKIILCSSLFHPIYVIWRKSIHFTQLREFKPCTKSTYSESVTTLRVAKKRRTTIRDKDCTKPTSFTKLMEESVYFHRICRFVLCQEKGRAGSLPCSSAAWLLEVITNGF